MIIFKVEFKFWPMKRLKRAPHAINDFRGKILQGGDLKFQNTNTRLFLFYPQVISI